MDKIKTFEDLIVWKKSHDLVIEVYRMTKDLPSEEKFGLVSQIKRAAVSIPANIAEGFSRRGSKDKIHFYNISQGSLSELQYYSILIKDLGFKVKLDVIDGLILEVGKMLNGAIVSLRVFS
ncbi:MAG: four helix bundle protein [Candidatus Omnitrophica bacterium]|jgi:four helix bundle protein|nr:four helix bundle protein [Candidatus Omnitrophota bacterium]MDD5078323.1 four helix bundle protein [Candidatus Omnitrophota bacterium]